VLSAHTAGRNFVNILATPGWRDGLNAYVREYQLPVVSASIRHGRLGSQFSFSSLPTTVSVVVFGFSYGVWLVPVELPSILCTKSDLIIILWHFLAFAKAVEISGIMHRNEPW